MRQIFLDTETTGLNPESGDRIVEIGCIEMVSRRLTGANRHVYLNPERKGNEEAIKVHGLTDAFLADKPKFAEVTDTLLMAREMFPGKANSLDALCRRLEVDNTHRTLHGALLDAGLLAEVYIRLTRGQDSLVIQADDASPGNRHAVPERDLSLFTLPVIAPSADELAAHDGVLAELDKASGGKTVWRALAA